MIKNKKEFKHLTFKDRQVIIDLLDNDFDIEDKNLKRENGTVES